MTSPKHPRGRPRGSGKDDTAALAQVADKLVQDASLKPATAMKRVMLSRTDWGATAATLLRRWQVKWQREGEALLAAARERAKPKPQPERRHVPSTYGYARASLALQDASMQGLRIMESFARPSLLEQELERVQRWEKLFQPSPLEKAIQDSLRWQKLLEPSPLEKAINDLQRLNTLLHPFGLK